MPGDGFRRVRVTARAKVNLGLAVGPLRPDGFHELITVFQSISLADTLVAARRASGFRLRVRHENVALPEGGPALTDRVPAGAENLVLRAARLFRQRVGFEGGAEFTLIKRIPAQAGLGGGSADAAAALRALEALSGRRLARARRFDLAAELGSDVPFATIGGTALGRGRGEKLERLRLDRPFRALIVVPRWRVSTARAYRQIDMKKFALTRYMATLRSASLLRRAPVRPGRALRLGNSFEDVLGENRKRFLALRNRLLRAGAVAVRLSGSGSAVLGIIPSGVASHVVAGRLAGNEPRYAVKSERNGLRIEFLP
ncbi:MAG TPA: 4-(cytidine 5'-diphospho)-2-C-methyl-D-erythritol kinase [Candidatus Sulfotelmatobacter sp.]|nr:4-(cytidine 5'-diphospho)-2-C-methyl-D-erythritol kinase [Candidatus Sulfotelmatobacter sp.]